MSGNRDINLKGTLGNYSQLFVSDKQMKHKEYKRRERRNKEIDREQAILDNEFRDNSYWMAKYRVDMDKGKNE